MLPVKAEIRDLRIRKVHIDISEKLSSKFKIGIESRGQLRQPKEKENRTALLIIQLHIFSADEKKLDITISADCIFEFSDIPADYNEVAEKDCMPMAQTEIYKKLDEILLVMGYRKLGLAEK